MVDENSSMCAARMRERHETPTWSLWRVRAQPQRIVQTHGGKVHVRGRGRPRRGTTEVAVQNEERRRASGCGDASSESQALPPLARGSSRTLTGSCSWHLFPMWEQTEEEPIAAIGGKAQKRDAAERRKRAGGGSGNTSAPQKRAAEQGSEKTRES